MTTTQTKERSGKAQELNVIKVSEDSFFVESSKGKVCYKVAIGEMELCTCGNFVKNSKSDPDFRCKHLLAVIDRNGNCTEGELLEKRRPRINESFIMNIQGKDFVKYHGLLNLAHQKNLQKLSVKIIQYPSKDNNFEAICRAVAETKAGDIFCDIGDANPKNCNKLIGLHLLRMASTRAKARALRDMTNIGMTCLEELRDIDDVIGPGKTTPANKSPKKRNGKSAVKSESAKKTEVPKTKTESKRKEKPESPKKTPDSGKENKTLPAMSEAQRRAMYNLSRRRSISNDELDKMSQKSFGVPVDDLSSQDASAFIRQLQTAV